MSEIAELETRIMAAMERIGRAVDNTAGATGPSRDELDHARSAAETAEAQARAAMERAEAAEAERDRIQQTIGTEATATEQLRERVGALQEMKERHQARITELESELRDLAAVRQADRAELEELVAALEPLVKEAPDA